MAIAEDITVGEDPVIPNVPAIALAVARAEQETVQLLRAVGNQEATDIKAAIHSRSGVLAGSVGVSVTRVRNGGVRLKFGSIKKGEFASRKGSEGHSKKQNVFYDTFVDQGTGVQGPRHQRIRNRGLIYQGSIIAIPSGDGQAPQGMFKKAAEDFATRSIELDGTINALLDAEMLRGRVR